MPTQKIILSERLQIDISKEIENNLYGFITFWNAKPLAERQRTISIGDVKQFLKTVSEPITCDHYFPKDKNGFLPCEFCGALKKKSHV